VTAASPLSVLQGETAAIATKHDKQRQFAGPLLELVGLDLIVAEVDTDLLGTFSGEVPRTQSALDTVRRKARWAIEHTGVAIGLASEGSFGPHPAIPWLPVGIELAVLVDDHRGLEIIERHLVTDTNFDHVVVHELPVPGAFLDRVGFPDHALVVTPPSNTLPLFKAVRDLDTLDHAVRGCVDTAGAALVQTDMRAHLNPTRQRALAQLALKLARRVASTCPACAAPGWGIVDVESGLPCEWCGEPTSQIAYDVFACARQGCTARDHLSRDFLADPGQCSRCNP